MVTAAVHLTSRSTRYQYWQRRMVVDVAVAHSAAVKNQRMVQKIAVAIGDSLQAFQ